MLCKKVYKFIIKERKITIEIHLLAMLHIVLGDPTLFD
jgi:hypothetical protein